MNAINTLIRQDAEPITEHGTIKSGWVTGTTENEYLIDGCVLARQADGLGTQVIVNDFVSYLATQEGNFIVTLLKAAPRQSLTLDYPCSERLKIRAEHLELIGPQSVTLRSLRELSLETCENIKLTCENLFQSAFGSLVSVMASWVHQCDTGSLQAKELLQTDAGSQIITASEDLRLDAKRINMG